MGNTELQTPDFDDLPPVEGMPQGCAWGVFDKDGKTDVLGTLNLLTSDIVRAAATEVKEGVSISLNWPLNSIKVPFPGRAPPVHTHQSLHDAGTSPGADGWDDVLEFNTQCSSQWDSLCHFAHQPSRRSYNGAQCTADALSAAAAAATTAENALPTLDHWHARGGLVGRGVLIDYKGYAEEKGIQWSPFSGRRIRVAELEEVARHQGVEFRRGDVLIVRTGYTEAMEGKSMEEQLQQLMAGSLSGVEGTVEAAKWVWDNHFAAVAGDSAAFEAVGPDPDSPEKAWDLAKDLVLHQYFLGLFGLSIGEMWDLKALAAHCKQSGRYSFMLTSAPLHVPALIGSPPNALAIF
ncbi:putative cyclase-domain-containing protein [Macrophomina phaseolina]|uniref:Cyclase-domain-containing protein n=1 Tax=Macrophomina phaseolina TaxID=35725 RepID=A0ABQ8GGG2_9PEZI|nr:putative cyclase-domain-containing protein [Macrophomina phaseolina]